MIRLALPSHTTVNPRQLAIVVLLAVVFIAVNVWPSGDDTSDDTYAASSPPRPSSINPVKATTDAAHSSASWPEYTLDGVISANPFDDIFATRLSKVDSSATTDESELLESVAKVEVQQVIADNVNIIFENANGRVAMMNSRLVRVGDEVAEGRIIEITQNHVVLEVRTPAS